MKDESRDVWGSFAPTGAATILLTLKSWGLARGSAKKGLGKIWRGMGLRVPVDILYSSLKFRVHPFDNTVEYKMLLGSKLRDEQELDALRGAVTGGGVFLDIGANIGYYALMATQQGAAQVLAFEPNPVVFSRLRFNIDANELSARITALPIALGDRVATMVMEVSDRDLGGGHIGDTRIATASSISVQVRPLWDVLVEHGITKVDAMKIDVEGMEDAVLFPFFETSARSVWPGLVIIEHTSQKQWKRDILAWMLESGYREIERNRSNAMLQLTDQ